MQGDIMGISRLRMGTDGAGITTLVTFFGCPLHCKYCANDFCHDDAKGWEDTVPRAWYTPEMLADKLKVDEPYFLMTGGGVTFGGGEPLLQSYFIHEVCKITNSKWKKRIETSLNVPWMNVEPVLNDFDEWIIDIKSMNPQIYEKYTAAPYEQMYENLLQLREVIEPSKLHVRIPNIPRFTDRDGIEMSVQKIKELFPTVDPEVFTYMLLPKTHVNKKNAL